MYSYRTNNYGRDYPCNYRPKPYKGGRKGYYKNEPAEIPVVNWDEDEDTNYIIDNRVDGIDLPVFDFSDD